MIAGRATESTGVRGPGRVGIGIDDEAVVQLQPVGGTLVGLEAGELDDRAKGAGPRRGSQVRRQLHRGSALQEQLSGVLTVPADHVEPLVDSRERVRADVPAVGVDRRAAGLAAAGR